MYDPGNGKFYASLAALDSNIDAYGVAGEIPIRETEINVDMNGDGQITEYTEARKVLLIRANPPQLDLRAENSNL